MTTYEFGTLAVPTYPTTTKRLLAIAEIVEEYPEWYDQNTYNSGVWPAELGEYNPITFAGKRPACGTTACMAGWGIIMTPEDELRDVIDVDGPDAWIKAGCISLGVAGDLGNVIFAEGWTPEDVAGEIRTIATLPVPRTLAAAQDAGVELFPQHDEDDDADTEQW